MARADLLLDLVRAGTQGDQARFRNVVEALIAEERSKQHHILADHLSAQLRVNGNGSKTSVAFQRASDYFTSSIPQRTFTDLVLPEPVLEACREIVEEHHRREVLFSHSLEPRHRILLTGPPGNGKTSLAEALATELMVPFYRLRYEKVIGSYLGETAQRLANLFVEARAQHCVLFLDEFETLGKERGDEHETGEIKRVVSSLLLEVDALPSHTVIVTATNHPELLDRAVWRRFQVQLELPAPGPAQIREWWQRYQAATGLKLKRNIDNLTERFRGASFSDLENFGADLQRRFVLSLPEASVETLLSKRLKRWKPRKQS